MARGCVIFFGGDSEIAGDARRRGPCFSDSAGPLLGDTISAARLEGHRSDPARRNAELCVDCARRRETARRARRCQCLRRKSAAAHHPLSSGDRVGWDAGGLFLGHGAEEKTPPCGGNQTAFGSPIDGTQCRSPCFAVSIRARTSKAASPVSMQRCSAASFVSESMNALAWRLA